MLTPNTQQLGTLPTAHDTVAPGANCGHRTHVGTCASCQRRQISKWAAQLQSATALSTGRTLAALALERDFDQQRGSAAAWADDPERAVERLDPIAEARQA
jgi:hypothetical protein